MPTIKKRVLDLIDDLNDYEFGIDIKEQEYIDDVISELRQLIEDNLLVSKDVFVDWWNFLTPAYSA